MDEVISQYPAVRVGDLMYCEDPGLMYEPDPRPIKYDRAYWQKYVRYEETPMSAALNACRNRVTQKYCRTLLDVGIGSGAFIKSSPLKVYGYDINPYGVRWLRENALFLDPYASPDVDGFTLWDCLEHMPEPSRFLKAVRPGQYVFLALPVFHHLPDIVGRKHHLPSEHLFYWSPRGLEAYLGDCGFRLLEKNDDETRAGRHDIMTFTYVKT